MNWALPKADNYFAPILAQDPRGFEIDHLELALRHCRSFRTAVDGGAHVGTWSSHMAKKFELVIAFEPAPDTYACLLQNLADVHNVDFHPVALGAVRTNGRIVDDPSRAGNTGARHLSMNGGGDVGVLPLDEFDLADLDFLKLDVEGYELHALRGAYETLRRCRPVVMIEAKNFRPPRFNVDAEAATRYLQQIGYRQVAAARNDRVFTHAD